ncbi:MAG: 30S ribosomal protein S4, partial [Candidatus Yanofskybacteria bacterium]|nr:30S ribosomal protein S4 [Candidatus Yanofskybacteria bacterium]
MARYTGPREKIERRIGEKLFLKGERSHSPKSATT